MSGRLSARVESDVASYLFTGAGRLVSGADCFAFSHSPPNTVERSETMTNKRRVGNRQLRAISYTLNDQDRELLAIVSDFRLITGAQLLRLFFHQRGESGARAARRCMERMTRAGLVRRLERRIGGVRAGSSSFIYCIDTIGQRILKLDGPRRRLSEPSETFVKHTLAIAELFVEVTEATRRTEAELLGYQTEPECWRRFGRGTTQHVLRPDFFVSIGIGELEYRWFVEVDRATEHLPAIVRKSSTYHDYYHSGVEQDLTGSFPRVLWATTTDKRADAIAASLSATTLTTQIFRVERLEQAARVLTEPRP